MSIMDQRHKVPKKDIFEAVLALILFIVSLVLVVYISMEISL